MKSTTECGFAHSRETTDLPVMTLNDAEQVIVDLKAKLDRVAALARNWALYDSSNWDKIYAYRECSNDLIDALEGPKQSDPDVPQWSSTFKRCCHRSFRTKPDWLQHCRDKPPTKEIQ